MMIDTLFIFVIAIPSLISASGISHVKHKYKWFEVNVSKLGAEHFDKKYGRGADGYVEGDKNYFDIVSFSTNGITSSYQNPRTTLYNKNGYPLGYSLDSFWYIFLPM